MTRKEKVVWYFNQLSVQSLHILPDFYAREVVFEDPINRLQGIDALTAYYAKVYREVVEIRFDFSDLVEEGDNLMASWVMVARLHSQGNRQPIRLAGISHLRFSQDRVIFHRDSYDLGSMVYERVPMLGLVIRWIKSKLAL